MAESTVSRPRRRKRVALLTLVVLLVLSGGVLGGLYLLSENLAGKVERVPSVFEPLDPQQRPAPGEGPENEARTILVVGTDSRSDTPSTGDQAPGSAAELGGARSDTIMLVRLAADRTRASVVSIPRDTWVEIPGRGSAKINAAFAHGGPALLIHTLEELTDVRVDHFAVVDFAGFRALTDAVGGIEVEVASATSNAGVDFHEGTNHLDGEQALAYVRQRHGLPDGDLDRVQRQQQSLKALLNEAISGETLRDPRHAYDLLNTVTDWVSVDDTLSNSELKSMVFDLRSLRPGGITYLTAPVAGTGTEGDQSVVYLDDDRAEELWNALNHGHIDTYVQENEEDLLDENVP